MSDLKPCRVCGIDTDDIDDDGLPTCEECDSWPDTYYGDDEEFNDEKPDPDDEIYDDDEVIGN